MELFLYQNGEQVGPYTVEQVAAMVASGAITRDDIVWREGLADWQPIHTVVNLPSTVAPSRRNPTPLVNKFVNDTNPFSQPQIGASTNFAISDKLRGLDSKQLNKLCNRSRNVNAITVLLGMGLIILVISLVYALMLPDGDATTTLILIGVVVFYTAALVGLYRRTSWGRILGIIVCIIALVGFPIGTIVGAMGLSAFFGAPELFGANRVTHEELKFVLLRQRANMKKS